MRETRLVLETQDARLIRQCEGPSVRVQFLGQTFVLTDCEPLPGKTLVVRVTFVSEAV